MVKQSCGHIIIFKPPQLFYISYPSLLFYQKQNHPQSQKVHTDTFPDIPSLFPRKQKKKKIGWENLEFLDSEILSRESLTKLPICRDNVPWRRSATITDCHPERKWLTNQNSIWLPILTPVSAQTHPLSLWSLHTSLHYIPCTRHVGDQNQIEVTEAVDCESNPTPLSARNPDLKKKLTIR